MAFRSITRGLFQLASNRRLYSTIQQKLVTRQSIFHQPQFRAFSAVQTNENAYKDLSQFLHKEIQLEKSAQQYPSKLPKIEGFEVESKGPEVTLTRKTGSDRVTVKLNVTNTVNASDSDQEADSEMVGQKQLGGEAAQSPTELKSRPTFTVDVNRGGQTLSFLCSYLPNDYAGLSRGETNQEQGSSESEQALEDFQIDEFAIHDGEWNEKIYSADCAVIDGELYDKLLNLLEEHGIGEEFANQLIDFSTAYEHRQYIDLLEKLEKFSKK